MRTRIFELWGYHVDYGDVHRETFSQGEHGKPMMEDIWHEASILPYSWEKYVDTYELG